MSAAATTIAGRYRLGDVLGRGGVGVVWHAYDELLGRDVAVKEVRFPPGLPDEERQALADRTLDEARQAATIDIAAAVRVFDIVEQDGRPWVVMELIDGCTLTDVLLEHQRLAPGEVARIGLCLLDALEAGHRAGLLHRDVKPSNVIVGPEGRIALTDFGIATVDDDGDTGVAIGSPAFLAPERALGEPATAASDLWSLGATLWTAVEGVPPYDGKTPEDVLRAITEGVGLRCRHCGGELAEILCRLMSRDPADRPDIATARVALDRVARQERLQSLQHHPLEPYPDEQLSPTFDETTRLPAPEPAALPRQRRTWPLVLAIVAVLAGCAVGLTLVLDSGVRSRVTAAARGEPGGGSSVTPSASRLPSSWHRYTSPTYGWSVGVPRGWTVLPVETGLRFVDPAGGRYFQVDVIPAPTGGALANWRGQEGTFAEQHYDYHRIALTSRELPGWKDAADWEFTYVDEGASLHALDRGVVAHGQLYALFFQTHTDQWSQSQPVRERIVATFRS